MKQTLILLSIFFAAEGLAQDKEDQKIEKFVTEMDFDSASIDGKMKAPSGFFLQGRNKQSLQSMVQLRSNFRDRLRNSKAAVKAIVK
ncbi:hypothetical protein [Pseudobacteriovorax antillogorgiicola]|uniref:Uncharacterized protein n=1 Tax=Pseudobacteriovorax antillogorgiicola TaxID=1513793 RepID=A0A1Y6C6U2_9BACT|nr:hypothetical protein [Pseudobacteriovorax antillogorgiicola]TCS49409.1 hypothetical protein EDD56_11589 [Pseudobacteriovorax antillogorgiicola]SMF46977.1 hypothetical protein SAMN06296036_11495 [Pseudobacteriovorax antillogorgiicola]